MTEKTTCKATLYSESPHFLIPSSVGSDIVNRDDSSWQFVGHVFFGITDEKGKETFYSFGPDVADEAPVQEQLPAIFGRKGSGLVTKNIEPYDDKMVYNISREQYDKIKTFGEESIKKAPNYNLLSYNCISFAYQGLKKAGLDLPKQPLIASPATLSLGIRYLEKVQKTKKALAKAASKILSCFSATKSLSKKILKNVTKAKTSYPVGIKRISKAIKSGALSKNGFLTKNILKRTER